MAVSLTYQGNDENALETLVADAGLAFTHAGNTHQAIDALAVLAAVDLTNLQGCDRWMLEQLAAGIVVSACDLGITFANGDTIGTAAFPTFNGTTRTAAFAMTGAGTVYNASYGAAAVGQIDDGCGFVEWQAGDVIAYQFTATIPDNGTISVADDGTGAYVGARMFGNGAFLGRYDLATQELIRLRRHVGTALDLMSSEPLGASLQTLTVGNYAGEITVGIYVSQTTGEYGVILKVGELQMDYGYQGGDLLGKTGFTVMMAGAAKITGDIEGSFETRLRLKKAEFIPMTWPVGARDFAREVI